MRASGSCLVEEWNLLAEETVEPMPVFQSGKRLPSFWKHGETTEDKTAGISHPNHGRPSYDHKWGTFN